MKGKVIPVLVGATGTISQSLRQYLSNIAGNHEIKELQKKNGHIGHCTHNSKSADVKVQNICHGRHNITCSTNCKYRSAATQYIYPSNMVCFRYIIVNNGGNRDDDYDDDDDDNNNNNNNNNGANDNHSNSVLVHVLN